MGIAEKAHQQVPRLLPAPFRFRDMDRFPRLVRKRVEYCDYLLELFYASLGKTQQALRLANLRIGFREESQPGQSLCVNRTFLLACPRSRIEIRRGYGFFAIGQTRAS